MSSDYCTGWVRILEPCIDTHRSREVLYAINPDGQRYASGEQLACDRFRAIDGWVPVATIPASAVHCGRYRPVTPIADEIAALTARREGAAAGRGFFTAAQADRLERLEARCDILAERAAGC